MCFGIMLQELLTAITDSIASGQVNALIALAAVAILMEIGFPFPFVLSSALLVVVVEAGVVSWQTFFLMLALFTGRMIGASLLFWSARLPGAAVIRWLEKRRSEIPAKIDRLSTRFERHVPLAITIARFTPGLLTVSSLAAGFIRVKYWPFALGLVISSLLSDLIILVLGYLTFNGLKLLGVSPEVWQLVVALMIATLLVWAVVYLVQTRRRSRA